MAAPVLVRAYTNDRTSSFGARGTRGHRAQALPPVSSYAFADILRAADCPDFRLAIDGIAEICAKNRMSLADEHSSHLPPLGEITASSAGVRTQYLRPNMRRALTSVPEASSGSSEGSHKSKKGKTGLFGFRRVEYQQTETLRRMCIGSMGRTMPIGSTTAVAASLGYRHDFKPSIQTTDDIEPRNSAPQIARRTSEAQTSLQKLLNRHAITQTG